MKYPCIDVRGPRLECREIVLARDADWHACEVAFGACESVVLRQAWRPNPEPAFRPGCVRVARSDRHLLMYAILEDDDIFNPETRFNQPSFRHGDVLEIFVRPENQDAYYEFHVTPMNQRLQLRIPSAGARDANQGRSEIPDEWLIAEPLMDSAVEVHATARCWRVRASIPMNRVEEKGAVSAWLFSFSRYDYTRGVAKPVLSSSSCHEIVNFHLQRDWGVLYF